MTMASQPAKARVSDKVGGRISSGTRQQGKRLRDRLNHLAEADRGALQDQWLQAFGLRPPVRLSRELLVLGLSYHVQCGSKGGLSPEDCVALGLDGPDWLAGPRSPRLSRGNESSDAKSRSPAVLATSAAGRGRPTRARPLPVHRIIKPGTRLLRSWQGETHEVIAESTGQFLYRGKAYRSLSAIARTITGTRWSGPTFFGIATASQAQKAGGGGYA
jgi:hypothetical protein